MPFDIVILMIGFSALFGYVVSDIVNYEPGEKRALEVERKKRTHVRSHHYKLPRDSR